MIASWVGLMFWASTWWQAGLLSVSAGLGFASKKIAARRCLKEEVAQDAGLPFALDVDERAADGKEVARFDAVLAVEPNFGPVQKNELVRVVDGYLAVVGALGETSFGQSLQAPHDLAKQMLPMPRSRLASV